MNAYIHLEHSAALQLLNTDTVIGLFNASFVKHLQ